MTIAVFRLFRRQRPIVRVTTQTVPWSFKETREVLKVSCSLCPTYSRLITHDYAAENERVRHLREHSHAD